MNIELWSDYTCPYCYIGKKRLELAIENLGLSNEISVELKSYQLDSNSIKTKDMSILEHFKDKYKLTDDEVINLVEEIAQQAAEVDLAYNYKHMKQQNTFDAHRLVKYAFEKNKGELMSERLLKAYFKEAAEISKHDVLLNLAKEIDLNEEEVLNLLSLNNYAKQVQIDIEEAKELEVETVPFFIFDDKYALSGLHSLENFMEVIGQTKKEHVERPQSQSSNSIGSCCVGDECE